MTVASSIPRASTVCRAQSCPALACWITLASYQYSKFSEAEMEAVLKVAALVNGGQGL